MAEDLMSAYFMLLALNSTDLSSLMAEHNPALCTGLRRPLDYFALPWDLTGGRLGWMQRGSAAADQRTLQMPWQPLFMHNVCVIAISN